MFFTGGTALRFFHNLPRFSEDLDFDTPGIVFETFKDMLDDIKKGFNKEGFSLTVSSEKRNNLFVAELNFPAATEQYKIVDKRGIGLMIKLEAYKPAWNLSYEPDVLSLYSYNFSAVLLARQNAISEKLAALLSRKRGRDIYDILFMLKKKFPFDENVLRANKIDIPFKNAILEHLNRLSKEELKYLANQVKPFLFREDDIEMVLKAPLYAERFLKDY
jgi:predicted nucleotidyltransferase component of viral defense system